MPETVKRNATVKTAYGETLDKPIEFDYTFEELQEGDPIPEKEMPDEDGLRSFVNQRRNAAARASAQNEALSKAGIQKPTLEDPEVRFKTMVKVLLASGQTKEQAEAIAKSSLGM